MSNATLKLNGSSSLSQSGRVDALAFRRRLQHARREQSCGMAGYLRGAHTVFEIHLHLVWITKYLRSALSSEVGTRVRDLIRDNVTDEVIAKYIAEQNIDQDEDFRVDG